MCGAVNVEAVVGRVRREVYPPVDNTYFSTDVQLIKPLHNIFSRRRACKALVPLSYLPASCRKDYYERAAKYFIDNTGEEMAHLLLPRMSRDSSVWQSPIAIAGQCISLSRTA